MSKFEMIVVVYLVVGLVFAAVRFVSYVHRGAKKTQKVGDAVQLYFCDLFLWWWKPAERIVGFFLLGNRLNLTGFEVIVRQVLDGPYSDNDLEALKAAIFQEQKKAIAAGHSAEQEAVNRWIGSIDKKIERRKTGAEFGDFLSKIATSPQNPGS